MRFSLWSQTFGCLKISVVFVFSSPDIECTADKVFNPCGPAEPPTCADMYAHLSTFFNNLDI